MNTAVDRRAELARRIVAMRHNLQTTPSAADMSADMAMMGCSLEVVQAIRASTVARLPRLIAEAEAELASIADDGCGRTDVVRLLAANAATHRALGY